MLAIIFIAFAILQYSDPDPYIWMFVYGVTSLLCINAAIGQNFRLGNISVIVFSLVLMLLLIPKLVEWLVGGASIIADAGNYGFYQYEIVQHFFGLLLAILTMMFHLRCSRASGKVL